MSNTRGDSAIHQRRKDSYHIHCFITKHKMFQTHFKQHDYVKSEREVLSLFAIHPPSISSDIYSDIYGLAMTYNHDNALYGVP